MLSAYDRKQLAAMRRIGSPVKPEIVVAESKSRRSSKAPDTVRDPFERAMRLLRQLKREAYREPQDRGVVAKLERQVDRLLRAREG